MKYTVHFQQVVSVSISVDIDPSELEDGADVAEVAIERAHDEGAGGICAQCSGWGQSWSRDDDGELIVDTVSDESGEMIYTEPEEWQLVRRSTT